MKILIAGLGSIGRRHLHNLQALSSELDEELDIRLYRTLHSSLPETELAGLKVESELKKALHWQPEAVIISNPTSLHMDVAIPAAEQGCHLLLEKPVSHNLDSTTGLEQAVRRSNSRVLVGYHFRFHPGLQKAAALLQSGVIGRVLSFRAHWGEYLPNWHPWENYRQSYSARYDLGGGVVLTLSHPVDYLRWLLGEIESLWAFTGKLSELDIDVEDTAEIGMRLGNGAIGSLHLDYNQQPSVHHLEVIGSHGALRWDNADGTVHLYQVGSDRDWESFPVPPAFTRNDLFLAEMRHFLAVIRSQATPACTLQDGLQALRLAMAVHESARLGQVLRVN